MRVTLTVQIEVDRYYWREAYGTSEAADEVRDDVRSYFRNHIICADAVESASLTVVVK